MVNVAPKAGHDYVVMVPLSPGEEVNDECWARVVEAVASGISKLGVEVVVSGVKYTLHEGGLIFNPATGELVYQPNVDEDGNSLGPVARFSMNVRKVGEPYAPLW